MTIKRQVKLVMRIACFLIGLIVAFYGASMLLALDQVVFGKFSAASRDTSVAFICVLIGAAIFLYGLWIDVDDQP
jgi:hypothetical protein